MFFQQLQLVTEHVLKHVAATSNSFLNRSTSFNFVYGHAACYTTQIVLYNMLACTALQNIKKVFYKIYLRQALKRCIYDFVFKIVH